MRTAEMAGHTGAHRGAGAHIVCRSKLRRPCRSLGQAGGPRPGRCRKNPPRRSGFTRRHAGSKGRPPPHAFPCSGVHLCGSARLWAPGLARRRRPDRRGAHQRHCHPDQSLGLHSLPCGSGRNSGGGLVAQQRLIPAGIFRIFSILQLNATSFAPAPSIQRGADLP